MRYEMLCRSKHADDRLNNQYYTFTAAHLPIVIPNVTSTTVMRFRLRVDSVAAFLPAPGAATIIIIIIMVVTGFLSPFPPQPGKIVPLIAEIDLQMF